MKLDKMTQHGPRKLVKSGGTQHLYFYSFYGFDGSCGLKTINAISW